MLPLLIQTAYATDGAAASTPSAFVQFLPLIFFFVIFYFLILRPQAKRTKEHRQMVDSLKEGNEVIFAGGFMGRIQKVQGDYLTVTIAQSQNIMVQRASVISVLPAGTIDSLK